jgi:hypothetical protein
MILRAILIGLIIAAGEVVNGNIRVRYLQRKLGRKKSRWISFFSGTTIFSIIAWLLLPWVNPENLLQCLLVGTIWVIVMTMLDLYVGRFVFKIPWKKILDDFNPRKGNLLGIGLLLLLCCPSAIFLLQ